MEMKRRSFLAGIIAAITAGTLATTPSLAIAPTPDLEPIAETIRQYQALVKLHHSLPMVKSCDGKQTSHRTTEFNGEMTQRFNILLHYMMNQFGKDECLKENVAEIFKGSRPEYNQFTKRLKIEHELTVEKLNAVVRGVIPVMVAKYVLGVHKMPVQAWRMTSWKPFVKLYADKLPNV